MSQGIVHVAAAVIECEDGMVLLALRPINKHQGGLWEFPGGKVEPGETVRDALCRELSKELGIQVLDASPLISIRHDYADKSVRLDVWRVIRFSGVAKGCEGQEVRWVSRFELNQYQFPAANLPIVMAATLPDRYLITGAFRDRTEFLSRLEKALDSGFTLVQFRAPWLEGDQYLHLAKEASRLCRAYSCKLLIKGEPDLLIQDWLDGIHLTSTELSRCYQADWRNSRVDKLLSASCHSQHELNMALAVGCHFATLSPVLSTLSHPDATPLGWEKSKVLTEEAKLPVFWLGGMGEDSIPNIKVSGGQGAAAISAWW